MAMPWEMTALVVIGFRGDPKITITLFNVIKSEIPYF